MSAKPTEATEASTRRWVRARWTGVGIVSITVLAAGLRFPTLDGQGFLWDEMVTVGLVGRPLGGMLSTIPSSENTPPLYYVLAWGWTHVFGTGDFGLRSLSALFGVAMVPVVYLIFRESISARAGLIGALLTAVNPFLVWYSQEARAYSLFALLGSVSLLFFARTLRSPSRRSSAWWGVSGALAMLTHYAAAFLVGAEALVLLAVHRRRPDIRWASVSLTAVGAALLPLAIHQRAQAGFAADWIGAEGLLARTRAVPSWFAFNAIGSGDSIILAGKLLIAACLVLGLVLFLFRTSVRERSFGLALLLVALIALFSSLVLAAFGIDVVIGRNLIAIWPAAIAVIIVGLGSRAAGPLGVASAAGLAVVGVGVVLAIASDQTYQRPAWDEAEKKLEATHRPAALVAAPLGRLDAALLRRYGLEAEPLPDSGAPVRNVAVLYVQRRSQPIDLVASPRPAGPEGRMRVTRVENFSWFTLIRLRSTRPVPLTPSALSALPPELFGCCGPGPDDSPFTAIIRAEH